MTVCKPAVFLFVLLMIAGKLFSQASTLAFGIEKGMPRSSAEPFYISSVLADPTDPAATAGIQFYILQHKEGLPAESYQFTASSTHTEVLGNNGIRIEKRDGTATLFLSPAAVGYTDIVLTLACGKETKMMIIHYAVSAASVTPSKTMWHTGGSDASAAVPVGTEYMLVADDELDNLFLYHRKQSGLPVSSFYYRDKLDLTDGTAPFFKEVDVEAGVSSPLMPGRSYWTGSMSNSANFNLKANRNRLFAVDIRDTGSMAHCSLVGYYDNLRQQLINWGNDNGYKFGKSAATGQNPKEDDGFNVEAMVFAPDNTTLYIGFRAPLVPVTGRKKAVLAPIQNFESWFNNGKPKSKPVIAEPIELDMGGRGFRDMIRLSNGMYIILAGSSGDAHTGAVYKWSGNAADSVHLLPGFNITNLNAEAALEIDDDKGNLVPNALQVLSDNGTTVYYNDNLPAKSIEQTNYRKFRSDVIYSAEPLLK